MTAQADPSEPPDEFANVLDVHGVPDSAQPPENNPISVFADQGAWHGYALPTEKDKKTFGGFSGPLYIAEEYPWWLSKAFSTLSVTDAETGKELKLSKDRKPRLDYLPGLLRQSFQVDGIRVSLELRFASDRTSFVTADVANTGDRHRELELGWHGSLLRHDAEPIKSAPKLAATGTGVAVGFAEVREQWDYLTTGQTRFEVRHDAPVGTEVDGDTYVTTMDDTIAVAPGDTGGTSWTESFTFTEEEAKAASHTATAVLDDPRGHAGAAKERWNGYLSKALSTVAPDRRKTAVKSVETLVTNWRSPAGKLKSDGITPSISYHWFAGGMWSWDSWKHAVAAARFDPGLAQSTVESLFDHQLDDGMIPDAVFYNDIDDGGGNWNERNTKPPLASWAVGEVYREAGDREFLERLYPKLVAYHEWWYSARDHDGDGIAEYGATVDPGNDSDEAVIEAAAWESGMDNAPRFDVESGVEVLENTDGDTTVGYSINQESVDLNSYLYAEKRELADMARELGKHDEAADFDSQAKGVREFVRDEMYDPKTGMFYDVDVDSSKPLIERGAGIETAIPLWTKAASAKQAASVRDAFMDPERFRTHVPLPTVSADSPGYDPKDYWRGPVWLDQAYFALAGLRSYGYSSEAATLEGELLANADGLSGDAPIHENYNPETGDRLNSPNFSWSAAAVLLLCRGELGPPVCGVALPYGGATPLEFRHRDDRAGRTGTAAVEAPPAGP
ncbi:MAG: MGH1-like glycoside hydrolase domain-containing protein, partial [Stackebrandtia sp.]